MIVKRNVYMFQPNYFYGKDAYLPYAIGSLAAYAWSDPEIQRTYELRALGYARNRIESVVKSLQNPFLCAFSCYVWNYEYNKALAREIKSAYPMCKIVFGGHQISRNFCDESENYVDVYIYDEGEIPFKKLLLAWSRDDSLESVPCIKYKAVDGGTLWRYTQSFIILETEFPSPYLTGIFDKIMEDASLSFTPTLETNRGCPFTCAYCDWGIYKSKLRQFPMERVKAEIDWFSEHKIDLVMGADSNFGIYARDEEIIDYMIFKKQSTGYPRKFRVSYTKNTGERVFSINQKLNTEGMCKGATLSFQSMNKDTLDAIGRKNISVHYFSELMERYNTENIPTYSEIILGLPEETFDSFCYGVDQLLENGQHTSINMYLCELLPNSAMAQPAFMDKYKITVADVILNQYHCRPPKGDILERSRIVTGTSSLPTAEWKKMYYYSLVLQSFHCLGLTQYIAIYLHYEENISYRSFYLKLLAWCMEDSSTVAGRAFLRISDIFEKYLDGNFQVYVDDRFGDLVWPLDEAWYLEILYRINEFYQELDAYLSAQYPFFMGKAGQQLLTYQHHAIYTPFSEQKELVLNYDFPTYFSQLLSGDYHKVEEGEFAFQIKINNAICEWDKFAVEVVWYGRKGGKKRLFFQKQPQ